MIARIRKSMQEKDQGFTLIELLVVMIIIGILAAIAIPVFLNQKKKAAEASAKSDATNISKELAAALVDGWPADGTVTLTGSNGAGTTTIDGSLTVDGEATVVRVGPGNVVTATYDQTSATSGTYCITATPSLSGANPWSAGNNGIFKGTDCTP